MFEGPARISRDLRLPSPFRKGRAPWPECSCSTARGSQGASAPSPRRRASCAAPAVAVALRRCRRFPPARAAARGGGQAAPADAATDHRLSATPHARRLVDGLVAASAGRADGELATAWNEQVAQHERETAGGPGLDRDRPSYRRDHDDLDAFVRREAESVDGEGSALDGKCRRHRERGRCRDERRGGDRDQRPRRESPGRRSDPGPKCAPELYDGPETFQYATMFPG